MPFFLKPCFKLRRKKKKSRKECPAIQSIGDETSSVPIEEIMQHCEPKSSFSSLNEDHLVNDTFHPDRVNTSINTSSKNLSTDMCEGLGTNPVLNTDFSEDKIETMIVSESAINNECVNEFESLEQNEEITNNTTIITSCIEASGSNEFLEKTHVQKSFEIINKVTVNSDVFKTIEELRDLQDAVDEFHQEILPEESEIKVPVIDAIAPGKEICYFCITQETDSDDLNANTESKIQSLSCHNKLISTVSSECEHTLENKTNSVKDVAPAHESGDKPDLYKSSENYTKDCVTVSADSYQDKAVEVPVKCNENKSLKQESKDSKNDPKFESEIVLVTSATESKKDKLYASTSETYFKTNETMLANDDNIFTDSERDSNEIESTVSSYSEIDLSKDIIVSNNIEMKTYNECTSQNNNQCEISEESSMINNQDTYINTNLIDTQRDFKRKSCHNIREGSEKSPSKIQLSCENLQLTHKTVISEGKNMYKTVDPSFGTQDCKSVLSNFKEGIEFPPQLPTRVDEKTFSGKDDPNFTEIIKRDEKNVRNYLIEKQSSISNVSHAFIKSGEFNEDTNNHEEDRDLKSYFNDFEGEIFLKMKNINHRKYDLKCFSLKPKKHYSDDENSSEVLTKDESYILHKNDDTYNDEVSSYESIYSNFDNNKNVLENITENIVKDESFNLHTNHDSCDETPSEKCIYPNVEDNETFICNGHCDEKTKKHKSELSLINVEGFMNTNSILEHLEDDETDQNIMICNMNKVEEANYDLDESASGIRNHVNPINCFLTALSTSSNNEHFSKINDTKNFEIHIHQNNVDKLDPLLKSSTFEKNNFDDRRDIMKNYSDFDDESLYGLCVDDNSYPDTQPSTFSEISEIKSENVPCSDRELKHSNSVANSQPKSSILQDKFDEILKDSKEHIFENAEYCQDGYYFREKSHDYKYQEGKICTSEQEQETTSVCSSKEEMEYLTKQTGSVYVQENNKVISDPRNNESYKLNKFNYHQQGFSSFYGNKLKNVHSGLLLRNEDKDFFHSSNSSSNIAKQQSLKQRNTEELQSKHLKDSIKEIHTKIKRGKKSVNNYSLSDCSNSSESSKLSESGDVIEQDLKNRSSDIFMCNGIGDSDVEKNFSDKADFVEKPKVKQKSKKSSELRHAYTITKKEFPKKRKGHKIEICITGKSSGKCKEKDPKHSVLHGSKRNSSSHARIIKLKSEKHIKDLTFLKVLTDDSQLIRKHKKKQFQYEAEGRTPFKNNESSEIEMKRIESINLIKERIQDILSQMGPIIRNIPIKKVDSLELKSCKVENFALNTDLKCSINSNFVMIDFPYKDINSPFPEEEKSDTDGKSKYIKNKLAEPGDSIQSGVSIEYDTDVSNECSEKLTPIRKTILDSSRLIRSPKYPFPFKKTLANETDVYRLQPRFIKSTKRKIVAHLTEEGQYTCTLKDERKIYSPDSRKLKIGSPTKRQTNKEDNFRHQIQHTQNYRAATPDDLKSKFDDVFKTYAGKGRCNGELISYKKSTEWLRDSGVIGKVLTAEEATDAFKCAAGAKVALNKEDYRQFLKKFTRVKKLNYNEVYEKLCKASRIQNDEIYFNN